jgi:hypothetical protein
MSKLFRTFLNTIFLNSPYLFEDGSRISHVVQFDILRYQSGGPSRKIVDIGLEYDVNKRIFKIDTARLRTWRDPGVPLNKPSSAGPPLTEIERHDIIEKLQIFQMKHHKKYEKVA